MLRILFSFVLVSAFIFLRAQDAAAASVDGVHPYDQPQQRIVRRSTLPTIHTMREYAALRQFEQSKYWTRTHMLHPYFRKQPYMQYLHKDNRRLHPYFSLKK